MYKEVNISDIPKNINLIDIRDKLMYLNGTLDNAKNIYYQKLFSNPEKYLNKEEEYYIFCSNGTSSKKLCKYLASIGYKVINIIGGYNSYKG